VALPKGLQFLQLGWWVLHALTIWFVWSWAYQRGRQAERRHEWQQRRAAAGRAARAAAGAARDAGDTERRREGA
jgi:hypothetical protein